MKFDLSRRGLLAAGSVALAAPQAMFAAAARAQDAAPAAPPPLAYTRAVGDLELTALSDGYIPLERAVFVNIAPEALDEALRAAFLDTVQPVRLGVTPHLVRGGGRTLLIDAGTADLFGPNLGRLADGLAAQGVAPEAVDAVLLTHMHPDHIGGLLADGAAAFPNAALHVSEADLAFWTDEAIAAQAPDEVKPFFARAAATAAAYGDRLMPFAGDVEVLPGIASVALPGHTPGHTGFRLGSGDAEILVFGDAAGSSAVQFSHPEASLAFDVDPVGSAATRATLFDMLATDRLLVAGTHMPFPGIGYVARSGEAYAWIPEEWQYR